MNQNHSPLFRFLVGSVRGYALCWLCLVTVGLWPFLLVWFLSFGLVRSWQRHRACATAPPTTSQPPALPPPLPPVIVADDGRSPATEDIQSFAA